MFLLPIGLHARNFRIPWGALLLLFSSLALTANNLWYQFEIENHFRLQEIILQTLTFHSPLQLAAMISILLAFSSYVEMRMGWFPYLVTYFATGLLGTFLQPILEVNDPSFVPLFSLTAYAGAFCVFFGKTPYRFSFYTLPKSKKTIFMPSWLFLIGVYLFLIGGHYASQSAFPIEALLGLSPGILVALLWKELSFLKKGFLFPIEVTYLLRAKKEADPLKKIDWILECLRINPSNPQAIEYLFLSIAKSKVPSHFFTESQKDIIAELISAIIKKTVKVDMNLVIYYFSLLPLNWNLSDIGLIDIIENDLDYMNDLLDLSEWRTAIRLYDAYLAKDADEEVRAIVIANIQTTLNELARIGLKPQDRDWLSEYILYHADGYASNLIKATIDLKITVDDKAS